MVGGLIDARTDPATARFDAELATAEASGAVSPEAAHRLRFWQRASVRALADHARTVLPIALGALDAARRDAEEHADQGDAALARGPTGAGRAGAAARRCRGRQDERGRERLLRADSSHGGAGAGG